MMRDNPLHTSFQFMVVGIPDQLALGDLRWFTVVLYAAMLLAGLAIAAIHWQRDPTQRTGTHVTVFGLRFVIAGMWYLGTFRKLPLPVSAGSSSGSIRP